MIVRTSVHRNSGICARIELFILGLTLSAWYLRHFVYMVYRYLFAAIVLDIDDSDTNMAGQG